MDRYLRPQISKEAIIQKVVILLPVIARVTLILQRSRQIFNRRKNAESRAGSGKKSFNEGGGV